MGGLGADPAVIEAALAGLRAAFDLDRVLLFGSRARGDALKDSDYDLLVVSRDFEGVPWLERLHRASAAVERAGGTCEVLAYTPAEFERRSGELSIVGAAASEGVVIYLRPGSVAAHDEGRPECRA